MQPVSVLHLVPAVSPGAIERSLYDVLSRLDPQLFRVTVAATAGPTPPEIRSRFAAAGIAIVDLAAELGVCGDGLRSQVRAVRTLRDRIRHLAPQIVHTHGTQHNIYGALAARLAGVRHIMTQDEDLLAVRGRDRFVLRWTARYPDVAFVPTHALGDARRTALASTATRILHLAHGVDLRLFVPPDEAARRAARAALGLPPEAFVLGAVGNLLARKRLDVLVDALPHVLGHVPHAHLLIAGDGPEGAALAAQAKALGVGERLQRTGWLAHPVTAYHALDVFVFLGEGRGETGLTLAEALACGLPAVAARNRFAAELAGEHAALQIEPHARALAHAVVGLARESQSRARLADLARTRAVTRFDVEGSARRLEEVYAHCVARTLRPRPAQPPRTV